VSKIKALLDDSDHSRHESGRWCVHQEGTTLHHTFKPMTNSEPTLDPLTAISGSATAIKYGLIAAVHSCPGPRVRSKTTEAKFESSKLHDRVHSHGFA
jgi:hypothetical protein